MENIWIHGEENVFEEFKRMGYTDEEARELADAVKIPITINPQIDIAESMKSLIEQFNAIGNLGPIFSSEELKKIINK